MKYLFLLFPTFLQAQWTEIYNFPGVLTGMQVDGSILTSHQSGTIRLNGDTIAQIETFDFNECGLLSACYYLGELTYNSSSEDAQYIVKGSDTLLTVPYEGTIHRGGDMVVEEDTLYISFGYGTIGSDSQDSSNLRGKIVRIFPPGFEPEIQIIGLRNPFSFELRSDTFYIGDVGSDFYEELNIFTKGSNGGWPCWEADTLLGGVCDNDIPFLAYPHGSGQASIIVGSFFQNWLYLCDHFSIRGYRIFNQEVERFQYPFNVTCIDSDSLNLYAGTYDGRIFQLEYVLSIDEEEIIKEVGKEIEIPFWKLQFRRYVDILGREYDEAPIGILYYDRWK